jgi:hypothetical protein
MGGWRSQCAASGSQRIVIQGESPDATSSTAASRALVAITGEHHSLCRLLLRRMIMRQRGVLRRRACQGGPVEINKVFASVAIHPMRDLDIGSVVVNVNGGAIAMGHPPASSTSTYQPEKAAQQDPLLVVPSGDSRRRGIIAGRSRGNVLVHWERCSSRSAIPPLTVVIPHQPPTQPARASRGQRHRADRAA